MEYVIFSVNFGLKTKMHSIVINKKILKLIYIYIYLKKKQQKKKPKVAATLFGGGGGARTTARGGSGHL
jgi:hypothetical protein